MSQYKTNTAPCRFFLQGACRHGKECFYSHDVNISKTHSYSHSSNYSTIPCRYFLSTSGCTRENCKFLHQTPIEDKLPSSEDKAFQNSLCTCSQTNFQIKPFISSNKRSKQKKQTIQALAILELNSDQLKNYFLPKNLTSFPINLLTQQIHYSTPDNAIRFSITSFPSVSERSLWLVEGIMKHQFCILSWIEKNLGLFSCIIESFNIKAKKQALLCYTNYNPGSVFPLPLKIRLWNIWKSLPKPLTNINSSSTTKVVSQNFANSFIEPDMKKLILQFAAQSALLSDESDSESDFDCELIDNDNFSSQSSEDSSDDEDLLLIPEELESTVLNEEIFSKSYQDFDISLNQSDLNLIDKWLLGIQLINHNLSLVGFCTFSPHGGEQVLRFSTPGAQRMLQVASAGCGQSSQLSEALSYELLFRLFNVEFYQTEIEVNYNQVNAPKLDYVCKTAKKMIGVSVTRAWNGGNKPYLKSDVKHLLIKKLNGLFRAHQCATPTNKWQIQILHIWAPNIQIAKWLVTYAQELLSSNSYYDSCPTMVLVSLTQFTIPLQYSFLYRCD